MTEERLHFLRERLAKAAEVTPSILALREKLLSVCGVESVPPGEIDQDVEELVQIGSLIHGPVQLYEMDASACHENVAKLWDTNPGILRHIGTGYALTPDGLWRQRSWGAKADGAIVETTALRSRYWSEYPRSVKSLFAKLRIIPVA